MSIWVVVLAGGEGRRLEEVATRHHGHARAKQFCDFGSGRTLLERTLDRARRLTAPERVIVVTNRAHRAEVDAVAASHPRIRWLEQPANRGTTPAIVLAVLTILEQDPSGRVVLLPSDHDISDEVAFTGRVREALDSLDDDPEPALLLGAEPEGPVDGYGWMLPVFWNGERWPRVSEFCEKPPAVRVEELLRGGACLNTFVLVAEAWTIAMLVHRHAPRWFRGLVGRHNNARTVEATFEALTSSGFSEDVLSHARDQLRMVPLGPVGWSDIGTPERLARAAWWPGAEAAAAK